MGVPAASTFSIQDASCPKSGRRNVPRKWIVQPVAGNELCAAICAYYVLDMYFLRLHSCLHDFKTLRIALLSVPRSAWQLEQWRQR